MSHSSTIAYTVTISSELGTNGDFTVTDTISTSNFMSGESATLDASSFKMVDENGRSVSISPTISEDGKSFTIGSLPELAAGGSYILTYRVNVEQSGNQSGNTTEVVKNNVTVDNGEHKHSANTSISYTQVVEKRAIRAESSNSRMRWNTVIRPGGTNIAGYTFTDTADADLTAIIYLYAFDSKGNQLYSKQESVTDTSFFTVSGNTFSFTFPDVSGVSYWQLNYYTEMTGESGETITTTNSSTVITPNEEESWTDTTKQTGTIVGKIAPTKTAEGYGEKDEDGIVPFYWNISVDYDGIQDTYKITDIINVSQVRRWANNPNGGGYNFYDWNAYPNDHYGTMSEIDAAIKGTLAVTVKDESGNETTLTYDELIAQGGTVKINYYTARSDSGTPTTDSSAAIRCFNVTISGVTPTNISFSYNTNFDTQHVSTGNTWRMLNQLYVDGTTKDATQLYTEPLEESGGIDKQALIRTSSDGSYIWTSGDYTFNYDNVGGELTFRLLATVADGADSLKVTDTLPEGFTIVEDSIKVGNFGADKNDISTNWTDNENVTITNPSSDNGNTLTVSVENIGTELTVRDNNAVVIQYKVKIDENYENLEGAEISSDGSGYTATKTFTNTATNVNPDGEDTTSSFDSTIIKDLDILSKTGAQVQLNGANTSTVHYSVKINEDAMDLLEDSNELELTDVMTSDELDFKLVPSSIVLYLVNEDGSRGEAVDPLAVKISQPETEDGTTKQTFTITVEDATAYILEYDFIADKREDASAATIGEFKNTISLIGYAEATDDTEVRGINVRASSNHAGLQLVKVDSKNNAKFLDANFLLEKYNSETGTYETVDEITLSGETGFIFDYFSTNCVLEGNTLYRITETDAPSGYILDETPFYFIIQGNVQDVRSGDITATNITISSEEEAKAAAGAPSGLDINMLDPNSDSYFEISNVKEPATGKAELTGTKNLTGRNLVDGEFTFTVTDEDGNVVSTGTNDAEGNITFTAIKYTAEQVGEYTYTVTEDTGSLGGVTYDDTSYEVTVKVEDNDNDTLDVNITYPDNGIVFNNDYDADGEVTLEATKELTGRTLNDGEFSFTVKEGDEVVATGTNDENGEIEFGSIEYTIDDIGTHTYFITEDSGSKGGVDYSSESYTVTVVVSDDGDGTLTATPVYPEDGVVFHNSYKAAKTTVTLGALKNYTGATLEDGQFSFELKDSDGNVVETVQNTANGTISFSEIEFTEAGEYTYTVSEVSGDNEGITYDDTEFTVTITVTDDKEGNLIASVDTDAEDIVFNNSYAAEGTVTLKATKELTGRDLIDGEFLFTAEDEDGNTVATGVNDENGNVEFTSISYTAADLGTHTYTITENSGSKGGVNYSSESYEVAVEVTDNGDGTLTANATYPEDGVVFHNEYTAAGSVTLEATKKLTGRDLVDGEFSFTVMDEDGNTVSTGSNDANGTINFTEIAYTEADLGTHTYTISEDAGEKGGVEYSTESYEVAVEVEDNGDGTLTANATYPEDGVVFHNEYSATGSVILEATKELTGRTLNDGEFSFTVTDEDGNSVATGSNDANGKVEFTEITYTEAEVGTHTYTITEDAGDRGGVDYSVESYTVTVVVSDNGDGTLTATPVYPEDGVVFHNSYKAAETTVTLGALKNYTGATLEDGQFSFELKDSDGNVVETVQNSADGSISFSALTFAEAGEYTYTISEVIGDEDGVTYDETVYTVNIVVTDDGEGRLVASVDTDSEDIVFNNEYTDPEDGTTSNPKTGDSSTILLWTCLLLSAILAVVVMMARKRKEQR